MKRGTRTKLGRMLTEWRQKYKTADKRGHAVTRRKIRTFLNLHKDLIKNVA